MSAAGWFDRIWERYASALVRSPSLTLWSIIVIGAIAVLVGALLTPSTNVNSILFVVPTLLAMFQGVRWIWATWASMFFLYLVFAFGVESVPVSSALITLVGLALFGLLLTWLARDRQRARSQAGDLEMMERNLRLATRRSNVRLFSQDTELRYTWAPNPARMYPPEELLGSTDADIFPPAEAQLLTDIKRQAMLNEREFREEVMIPVGGETRVIDLTVVPTYQDVDGVPHVSGVTCIAVDVTDMRNVISEREELVLEQETALAQVARAQENLERFTSMIAHDLLQPLTVIQGNVSLLGQWLDPAANERQQRALDSLTRAVEQMRHLIDDLRDVAALEQGRFTLDAHPVDFVSVLSEVTSDYQGTEETHRINVQAPDHLWGHLDPSRIRQLLGNLLSNAIKYSPDGGDIDITVSVERNMCRIDISDNGLGMSPDEFGALFEKFSRLGNAHSIQGLGLGLYISKGIAEAHGGDITVESEPGVGSTFTVTLPLGPRVEADQSVPPTGQSGEEVHSK